MIVKLYFYDTCTQVLSQDRKVSRSVQCSAVQFFHVFWWVFSHPIRTVSAFVFLWNNLMVHFVAAFTKKAIVRKECQNLGRSSSQMLSTCTRSRVRSVCWSQARVLPSVQYVPQWIIIQPMTVVAQLCDLAKKRATLLHACTSSGSQSHKHAIAHICD